MNFLLTLAALSSLALASPLANPQYKASLYTGTHCNGQFLGAATNNNNRCVPLRIAGGGFTNAASVQINSDQTDHSYTFYGKGGHACDGGAKLTVIHGNQCASGLGQPAYYVQRGN